MKDNDYLQIRSIIHNLTLCYPSRRFNDEQLAAYTNALKGTYTPAQVQEAANSAKNNSKFFPSIKELKDLAPKVRGKRISTECEGCWGTGARFTKSKKGFDVVWQCPCPHGKDKMPSAYIYEG